MRLAAEMDLNANLKICTAIALLATCGCLGAEPADQVWASRNEAGTRQPAEPQRGGGIDDAPVADAGVAGDAKGRARVAEVKATDSTRDATPRAGKGHEESDRRLTQRQKRIFVLGLAAKEKK